jgi:hypothetical protein
LVNRGIWPKAGEILEEAKATEPRLESWSAKGVSVALAKYGLKTSKSGGRKVFKVVSEDIERISETYGLETG